MTEQQTRTEAEYLVEYTVSWIMGEVPEGTTPDEWALAELEEAPLGGGSLTVKALPINLDTEIKAARYDRIIINLREQYKTRPELVTDPDPEDPTQFAEGDHFDNYHDYDEARADFGEDLDRICTTILKEAGYDL